MFEEKTFLNNLGRVCISTDVISTTTEIRRSLEAAVADTDVSWEEEIVKGMLLCDFSHHSIGILALRS